MWEFSGQKSQISGWGKLVKYDIIIFSGDIFICCLLFLFKYFIYLIYLLCIYYIYLCCGKILLKFKESLFLKIISTLKTLPILQVPGGGHSNRAPVSSPSSLLPRWWTVQRYPHCQIQNAPDTLPHSIIDVTLDFL